VQHSDHLARRLVGVCFCGVVTGLSGAAAAGDVAVWTVGAYYGQGVRQNFRDVPGDAVEGKLQYVDSYETGVFVQRDIGAPDWLAWVGEKLDGPARSKVSLTGYGARGLGRNQAVALDWRPSVAPTVGAGLSVEFAWGLGVWHAFGTPWYNHHGDKELDSQYHTMLHMTPEIALRHQAIKDWSFGVRIDHESGMYGAVAPSALGTNHVGFVVARDI